jgi:hypothetical protein
MLLSRILGAPLPYARIATAAQHGQHFNAILQQTKIENVRKPPNLAAAHVLESWRVELRIYAQLLKELFNNVNKLITKANALPIVPIPCL